jgi:hypothetical protein
MTKLCARFPHVELTHEDIDEPKPFWCVYLYKVWGNIKEMDPDVEADGDSASLAICRAALKAVQT